MNVLIVHAHEEPKSFNAAMLHTAVKTLTDLGHEVEVSDLYAMNFNPVGGKQDFLSLSDPGYFKYGVEQANASAKKTFVPEVENEQTKLLRSDLLIFQFPLWWFGLPAILKGWVDRVFAAGLTYSSGRMYNHGEFRGKRAMLSLTTGGPPNIYSPRGLNGEMTNLLYPIQHGIFYFVGFDVLPPYIAYAVARQTSEERAEILAGYAHRLRDWEKTQPLLFPKLEDYDGTMQLK